MTSDIDWTKGDGNALKQLRQRKRAKNSTQADIRKHSDFTNEKQDHARVTIPVSSIDKINASQGGGEATTAVMRFIATRTLAERDDSLLLGKRPVGSLSRIQSRSQWAGKRAHANFSADDHDYLWKESLRLIAMSKSNETRKGYEVAVGHFRKFMRRNGFESNLLHVDCHNDTERAFAVRFFASFTTWLCSVCTNQQRVVGLAKAETISEYVAQVIIFHRVESRQRINLDFVKPTIKDIIAGRKNELTDSIGVKLKAKKVVRPAALYYG